LISFYLLRTDEMTDPAAQPVIWISKWVDYSDKYGFGYQLSDDGVGVMYNDGTRLIMLANGFNIHYINREGDELYYTMKEYPSNLEKKMKLMNFFLKYMNEHLMKAGGSIALKQSDSLSRIPYMHQWFRTQTAVVMQLTNGTVQVSIWRSIRTITTDNSRCLFFLTYFLTYSFLVRFIVFLSIFRFRIFCIRYANIFIFRLIFWTIRRLSCVR